MKRSLTIAVVSIFLFFICAAPTIRFQALKPSFLNIPGHINSIAVVDRSVQIGSKILESMITAEMPGSDKIASQFALEGLFNIVQNASRLEIKKISKVLSKNEAPKYFPEPLDWTEIDKLCKEYNVDAIVALEIFDSDHIIPAKMIRVTTGFRFYDNKNKLIIDQIQHSHQQVWETHPTTIEAVVNRLIEKENAIQDIAYEAGKIYGRRISPSYYTIEREYYRKAKRNSDLAEGARMMEANNWNGAIDALQRAMDCDKRKVKGRAAHNLAIVYEILGDYLEARSWAQDAWGKYANKGSRHYAYALQERISEDQFLKEQEE